MTAPSNAMLSDKTGHDGVKDTVWSRGLEGHALVILCGSCDIMCVSLRCDAQVSLTSAQAAQARGFAPRTSAGKLAGAGPGTAKTVRPAGLRFFAAHFFSPAQSEGLAKSLAQAQRVVRWRPRTSGGRTERREYGRSGGRTERREYGREGIIERFGIRRRLWSTRGVISNAGSVDAPMAASSSPKTPGRHAKRCADHSRLPGGQGKDRSSS